MQLVGGIRYVLSSSSLSRFLRTTTHAMSDLVTRDTPGFAPSFLKRTFMELTILLISFIIQKFVLPNTRESLKRPAIFQTITVFVVPIRIK